MVSGENGYIAIKIENLPNLDLIESVIFTFSGSTKIRKQPSLLDDKIEDNIYVFLSQEDTEALCGKYGNTVSVEAQINYKSGVVKKTDILDFDITTTLSTAYTGKVPLSPCVMPDCVLELGGIAITTVSEENIKSLVDKYLNEHGTITKLRDYLYTLDLTTQYKTDYKKAENWWESQVIPEAPQGCTGVINGDEHIRNFDFPYSNDVSFIVRTSASEGRYASVGMCGSMPIKADEVLTSDLIEFVPYRVVDGMNSEGLSIQMNVVSAEDYEKTTGTNPEGERTCAYLMIREVLDTCATVDEAIVLFQDRDIWVPNISEHAYEYHWLVSDYDNSAIIEIIGNEVVYDKKSRSETMIMTNLYNHGMAETGGIIDKSTVNNHAIGIERYKIAYDAVESLDSREVAEALKYTQTYTNESNYWYSEYNEGPLTVNSLPEDYGEVLAMGRILFEKRDRNEPITWQTIYSIIYNNIDMTYEIAVQEDYNHWIKFNFWR